jgi:hypothetical protein
VGLAVCSVTPAKERTKRSPAGGQALFPAGRVFLQGCFADHLRDGDSNATSYRWRKGFEQIPCDGRAGNFSAAAGNFFTTTGKSSPGVLTLGQFSELATMPAAAYAFG